MNCVSCSMWIIAVVELKDLLVRHKVDSGFDGKMMP